MRDQYEVIMELDAAEKRVAKLEEALRWISEKAGPQGCGLNEAIEVARSALA